MKDRKRLAYFLLILFVLTFGFAIYRIHRRPPPVAVRGPLPDYSGIKVDHVVEIRGKPGRGASAGEGDTVKVRYQMWIYDPAAPGNHGQSLSGDKPQEARIEIGKHEVIRGWEESLIGMKENQETVLLIPAKLGYGEVGTTGKVPGGAILQIMNKVVSISQKAQSEEDKFTDEDSPKRNRK